MAGRVIYIGAESQIPVGGIRLATDHVATLVEAGVEAYRWTPTPGFRYTWFEDTVPTLSGWHLDLTEDDVLVLPELAVLPGRDPAPGARKVVLNQAHFLTFVTCPDIEDYPGWSPTPSLWTISRESAAVLARAVPHLPPADLIPNPVDTEVFRPGAHRRPSVAWMPRKRPADGLLLRRILRNDPRCAGVELREIKGLSHDGVAEVLATTSVFVAFNSYAGEGFGLPAAEALAAGCLVTGYPAGGGEELFEAPAAWAVAEHRPTLLADKVFELLEMPGQEELRAAGRQWIQERYTRKVTSASLLTAVAHARSRPGGACRAQHPAIWEPEVLKIIEPYTASIQAAS
ncbi:glycosyltransferase [Goodfellowiella coeruleoviolacea]|uniref:Glycosyl transferases group 1 n=1 Tax=Goodfellowiella coeruleoviolacea TaxID=334858 RepID=A0AAE3KID0_9PSEU|nr:glycosyltransferase [Goodfellowiella coeruleoviolacea]MCP2167842.1 Glycosyl transferases group 1 [Goodfellowiella coeruleoviolacea]